MSIERGIRWLLCTGLGDRDRELGLLLPYRDMECSFSESLVSGKLCYAMIVKLARFVSWTMYESMGFWNDDCELDYNAAGSV